MSEQSAVNWRDIASDGVTRRDFMRVAGLGAGALAASAPRPVWAGPDEPPPNIILMMADDCSAKEFGCYGNADAQTPNLDALAQTGVQFETCWCTPICSPTRAEIMTGRYGFRTRWFHNNLKTNIPLCRDNLTIGQVMKQAGYATTIVGKWQLPGTQKQHGFDDYFMWLGGHNLCRKLLTDFDGPVEKEGQSLPGRPARYWHPAIVQNGALVNTTATDYGPALFVEYIKTYMAEHRNDPFFVYFPMCIPHMSWDFEREKAGYLPSPELDASGKPTGRKSSPTLTSNVAYIDYMVGELVAQLERLDLRHNTILLFTCDNGTAGYGKGHVEEERGPRVPMIVNGPGLVKALGERPELIDFSDVLPTLADLAGASLPDDYVHDGHSFAPLLTGKPYVPREWIFSYYAVHRMIRDRRWLQDGNRRFYDCGDRRNEQDYKDVTESNAPEVVAAKARFDSILAGLPPPPEDMRKAWEAKKRAQQTGRRRKKAR